MQPVPGVTHGRSWLSPYAPPSPGAPFVALASPGFVEGPSGCAYTAAGALLAPPGSFPATWAGRVPAGPRPGAAAAAALARPGPGRLVSLVQPYGWMYYHFVAETLPRLLTLRELLPVSAWAGDGNSSAGDGGQLQLLMWGQPWEAAWLRLLRLPAHGVVVYDPSATVGAAQLLVPTPTQAVTPQAEGLRALRDALRPARQQGEQHQGRPVVVYCSRAGERSRRVANERALLAALRSAFPRMRVVVHTRQMAPAEAVALFAGAAAVVGPHGAGLSHALFCPPGAALVELLFMRSPPLMFWHIAAAQGLRYAAAPQPRSYW